MGRVDPERDPIILTAKCRHKSNRPGAMDDHIYFQNPLEYSTDEWIRAIESFNPSFTDLSSANLRSSSGDVLMYTFSLSSSSTNPPPPPPELPAAPLHPDSYLANNLYLQPREVPKLPVAAQAA